MKPSRPVLPPRCECADHACPHHVGRDCADFSQHKAHRVDMEDRTGVLFCDPCFEDAMESGLFG